MEEEKEDAISPDSIKPRGVALLEINALFILNKKKQLDKLKDTASNYQFNADLINDLKDKGILDLYFFTDITLSQKRVLKIQALINSLKNKFKVHGVITPGDLIWNTLAGQQSADEKEEEGVNKEVNSLYESALMEKRDSYVGKFSDKAYETFVHDEGHTILEKLIHHYSPDNKRLGQTFRQASIKPQNNANDLMIIKRSHVANSFATRLATKSATAEELSIAKNKKFVLHSKRLMLDFFLRKRPKWVNRIVIVDHRKCVVDNFTHLPCLVSWNGEIELAKPADFRQSIPSITPLTNKKWWCVNKKEASSDVYSNARQKNYNDLVVTPEQKKTSLIRAFLSLLVTLVEGYGFLDYFKLHLLDYYHFF